METVSGYSFKVEDLRLAERRPGISAFMRIRNGADFLEAAIRSHIDAFDEIVAVDNRSTDGTTAILERLAHEYGPKIRLYHYSDRVHPPGSEAHAREPSDSPHSLVNYYNFSLSRTRCTVVTKLDDDHLAMPGRMRALADAIRQDDRMLDRAMVCFSGVNLARNDEGRIGLPANDLLCGNGDHWFFRVSPETWFQHDRRFEKLRHPGLSRRFHGFAYWHLKYLKPGAGFANYELEKNLKSRYVRRLERIRSSAVIDMREARAMLRPGFGEWISSFFGEKRQLLYRRAAAFDSAFEQQSVEGALDVTSPGWRDVVQPVLSKRQ